MFYKIITNNILKPTEKYDFFIYAPHSGYQKKRVKIIKQNLHKNNISDELLYDYIVHEADIGSLEISKGIYKNIIKKYPELKICLILGEIPRGFCDLNRYYEKACPAIIKDGSFNDEYYLSLKEINNYIYASKAGIHIHTMCGKDNELIFNFDKNTDNEKLKYFLENSYNGKQRNDNLLTSDKLGNYYTEKKLDDLIEKYFKKENLVIDNSKAYTLELGYPVTKLAIDIPSSIIEITKTNIATQETKNFSNTSKIKLDNKKINLYTRILTKSIIDFIKQ